MEIPSERPDDFSIMNAKIAPESELLNRAAAGDDLAIQQLLFPHIAHLSRSVADRYPRLDLGMVTVDDIIQETLAEAYRHIPEARDLTWTMCLFQPHGEILFWRQVALFPATWALRIC